jgi:hypothetical protein
MGAPTSSIFSEVFIQHLESLISVYALTEHNIITYNRYVDDILIVYNRDTTNNEHLLSEFNDLHPSIHFTIETETDNKLNFLDVSIHRTQSELQFGIYR